VKRFLIALAIILTMLGATASAMVMGVANAVTPSATGMIVSTNGLCLDVRNAFGDPVIGDTLQLWQCGAGNGQDQIFTLSENHATESIALTFHGFCVTDMGHGNMLALETCTVSNAAQTITKTGGALDTITFGTGQVMDNRAARMASGNPVIAFNMNGGTNQNWSDPL
jgi:Ricin-type beta-trefoil lectin domain